MRQFGLTDVEDQHYKEWAAAHEKECTVVSSHTFKFTPNGIGNGIEVECSCGSSVNVTDSSVW